MYRAQKLSTFLLALTTLFAAVSTIRPTRSNDDPARDYLVYVVCESADKIALVRFGPKGARVDKLIDTGIMVPDIDGPHGIVISPNKDYYYVSLGHGRPFGSVLKYSSAKDEVAGRVILGMFPATMDISRDGNFLYVVNFNLHGDPVPSSVSIVATEVMMEVARVQTCVMPHGSRINPSGSRQYSACMMDDALVEIDTGSFKVSRHFILTKGKEREGTGPPPSTSGGHAGHQMDHGSEPAKPGDSSCSPTWAQPSKDGSSVYVACNKSDEIVELEVDSWKVKRRLKSRPGVYNLAVTSDNKLLATNKRDQSVSVIDLKTGNELVRLPTRRKIVHGVVVSPDDRFAFVTVEGVGSEPGTLEVIDLSKLKTVATVDLPEQAAGVDFFRMEPIH